MRTLSGGVVLTTQPGSSSGDDLFTRKVNRVRTACQTGRFGLVSTDGTTFLDLEKASDGRFGAAPRLIFDEWEEFRAWVAGADLNFAGQGVPLVAEELDAPSPDPRQVFAIGLNYRDHAVESKMGTPDAPPTFTKWVGSFAGPVGDLQLPSTNVDWEAELVVVIGRYAAAVSAALGWDYVAGVTAGQDYSERAVQLAGPVPQFSLGKSYPGFAPQGPFLVTPDELADRDQLAIECRVNGETVQKSDTGKLIFSVPQLIEHLSAVVPLHPGDVIFTGTPAGVGAARTPPWFLKPGDVVETTIEGVGGLRQITR